MNVLKWSLREKLIYGGIVLGTFGLEIIAVILL